MHEKHKKITPPDRFTLLSIGLVIVLGFIIYSNTFQAEFHFDDIDNIVNNPHIRDIRNVPLIWDHHKTRFLTFLSFALNYHFSKLDVSGYHVVNLAGHILTSVVLYFLTLLIFKTPGIKNTSLIRHENLSALFISLIFLSHPLQTQGVTYIVQRAAVFTTLFYILTVYFYIRARLQNNIYYHGAALAMTLCAMLSKPLSFTLPLMLCICEITFFGVTKEKLTRRLRYLSPYLCTLVIVPLLVNTSQFEVYKFGGLRDITRQTDVISRGEYLLTQGHVLMTYLRLLFLPVRQSVDYDYPIAQSLLEVKTSLFWLCLSGILFWAFRNFKRNRLVAFGIFWFFTTLLVESGVYPLADVIFEHRLYLPMVGFAIFLTMILAATIKDKKIFIAILSCIVILFGLFTFARNKVWQNEFTLWEDVIKKFPRRARAYLILGNEYAQKGDYPTAIAYHENAIGIDPQNGNAHYSLGKIYIKKGNPDKAIECFEKAVELSPDFPDTYFNMALAYEEKGDKVNAEKYYKKTLALDAGYSSAANNLGLLYAAKGKSGDPLKYYLDALAANPNNIQAIRNVAAYYAKKGDDIQAISYYQKALRLVGDDVDTHLNLALAFDRVGNIEKAKEHYEATIVLDDKNKMAYNNLAVIFLRLGKFQDAIFYAEKAIDLQNDFAEAYATVGAGQLFLHDLDAAKTNLEKAIELYKKQGNREKIRPIQNILRSIPQAGEAGQIK